MSVSFLRAGSALTLAATLIAACTTAPSSLDPAFAERPVCDSGEVRLDAAFEGGAMQSCEVLAPRAFAVVIAPEDIPINPSPWYALRLSPYTAGPVVVTLDYAHSGHRYRPKLSADRSAWTELPDSAVSVSEDRERAELAVELGDHPVFLAGQELYTGADYERWLEGYAGRDDLTISEFGRSIEDRPLTMIRSVSNARRGAVILVGRQHPPEVTAALAMEVFLDEVLGESDLARRFRDEFDLVIVPQMNPDGVHHGYWRHNLGGTDLNRDWGPFAQPETRAFRSVLDALDADERARPVAFLDFHSTRRDVFYTQLIGEDGTDYGFTAQWLERAGARLAGYEIERAERPQSERPTSKNYMFARYNIPAITYEIGDNTDRDLTARVTTVFAQEMMSVLLEHEGAG